MKVEFKYKDGSVKVFSKVFALELERRNMGKIIFEKLTSKEDLKKRIAELDAREKAIEKREKVLEAQDGTAKTRKTK